MLTAEQAVAIVEADSPGADIDQAWMSDAQLAVFFSGPGFGEGPTVVDLRTGRLTYPGSAADPAQVIEGMTRLR